MGQAVVEAAAVVAARVEAMAVGTVAGLWQKQTAQPFASRCQLSTASALQRHVSCWHWAEVGRTVLVGRAVEGALVVGRMVEGALVVEAELTPELQKQTRQPASSWVQTTWASDLQRQSIVAHSCAEERAVMARRRVRKLIFEARRRVRKLIFEAMFTNSKLSRK